MNTIKQKLRSRTGASITFALLLFLVCAILCSVILAASTSAAGRMSRIAETDQRYYGVTAAAELLTDLIDGKTVSIVEVTETQYTTNYSGGTPGTPTAGETTTSFYIVENKKAGEITSADLTDGNVFVPNAAGTSDSILEDAAKSICRSDAITDRELGLASSFYGACSLDYDALSVTILENIDRSGTITFTLYNTYSEKDQVSSAGSRYTLYVPFSADRSVTTDSRTEPVSSAPLGDDSYTEVTKTTVTTVTTLTWTLNGIRTGS